MITLAIPDLHCPFQHPEAFDFIADIIRDVRPDEVVILGDEADFHGISFHNKDPDGLSAGMELMELKRHLKTLFKVVGPDAKVCVSNHTSLPFRRAFSEGLPAALFKNYAEVLEAPGGWKWQDSWVIDGVRYQHGTGYSGKNAALNAAETNRQSTVIGHVHSFAGIQYSANDKDVIWGMNCGWLGDVSAYAFEYGKYYKHKPILGCGIIADAVPIFQPFRSK